MPNEIIIDENGEDAQYVVCIKVTNPLKFEDNLVGHCTMCKALIQYRPHGPKTPPKVCWECIEPEIRAAQSQNDLGMIISEQTRREVVDWLEKKKRH